MFLDFYKKIRAAHKHGELRPLVAHFYKMRVLVLNGTRHRADTARVHTVILLFVIGNKVNNLQSLLLAELLHAFNMALGHDDQMVDNVVTFPDVVLREIGDNVGCFRFLDSIRQGRAVTKRALRNFLTCEVFFNCFPVMVHLNNIEYSEKIIILLKRNF